MGTVRTGEEMAALYRQHVDMVYQICLMLMKNVPDVDAWEEQENHGNAWGGSVVLRDQSGKAIAGSVPYSSCSPYAGQMLLNFGKIYDPAQFQGGTVTIMGQTFSLDNLQPVR